MEYIKLDDHIHKAVIQINQCESLADVEPMHTRVSELLDIVNEIVEWNTDEYWIRITKGRIIFWFKQERHALLTILRCA